MVEIWKPISGFEGLYEISNFGNVKSLNYQANGYSKNLTPKVNNKGYLWVELWKDKKRHCFLVHRLVAMHFMPKHDANRNLINHIDENPKNNIFSNLEWCTPSENIQAYMNNHKGDDDFYPRNKRRRKPKRKTKYSSFQIIQSELDGTVVSIHDNVSAIARAFGYNCTSIWECCTGKRKTAYGYKWQFAN